jgi:hypothetical protein
MRRIFFFLPLLIATSCFGQTDRKLSTFFSFQVNKTLYDRTKFNNSGGIGLGLHTFLNTKTLIKPTLEINADLFAGTKVLYLTADGKPIYGKHSMLSIHAGPSFSVTDRLFIATTIGSHIYNSDVHFGVRPFVGFYPSKRKLWSAKVSFTNVFQQDHISNESFGYASFGLAAKLF